MKIVCFAALVGSAVATTPTPKTYPTDGECAAFISAQVTAGTISQRCGVALFVLPPGPVLQMAHECLLPPSFPQRFGHVLIVAQHEPGRICLLRRPDQLLHNDGVP